jgi:hypothetical protein
VDLCSVNHRQDIDLISGFPPHVVEVVAVARRGYHSASRYLQYREWAKFLTRSFLLYREFFKS